MSNKQRIVKLPSKIILSILKTEAKMDEFLAKQSQIWEVENLA
jgi:hypothetical protein